MLGQRPSGLKRENEIVFLRLENKHQASNIISKIKDVESNIYEKHDVLGQICSFYEKLYRSNEIEQNNIDTYLNDINVPTLTNDDKVLCDSFPSIGECANGVKYEK